MKFSQVMLAMTIGFTGGLVVMEFCPAFKQMVDKGKQMLSKKN